MEMVRERGADTVVLNNVSWQTYESLLKDHESSSAPRFTYNEETLTIMSPLPKVGRCRA